MKSFSFAFLSILFALPCGAFAACKSNIMQRMDGFSAWHAEDKRNFDTYKESVSPADVTNAAGKIVCAAGTKLNVCYTQDGLEVMFVAAGCPSGAASAPAASAPAPKTPEQECADKGESYELKYDGGEKRCMKKAAAPAPKTPEQECADKGESYELKYDGGEKRCMKKAAAPAPVPAAPSTATAKSEKTTEATCKQPAGTETSARWEKGKCVCNGNYTWSEADKICEWDEGKSDANLCATTGGKMTGLGKNKKCDCGKDKKWGDNGCVVPSKCSAPSVGVKNGQNIEYCVSPAIAKQANDCMDGGKVWHFMDAKCMTKDEYDIATGKKPAVPECRLTGQVKLDGKCGWPEEAQQKQCTETSGASWDSAAKKCSCPKDMILQFVNDGLPNCGTCSPNWHPNERQTGCEADKKPEAAAPNKTIEQECADKGEGYEIKYDGGEKRCVKKSAAPVAPKESESTAEKGETMDDILVSIVMHLSGKYDSQQSGWGCSQTDVNSRSMSKKFKCHGDNINGFNYRCDVNYFNKTPTSECSQTAVAKVESAQSVASETKEEPKPVEKSAEQAAEIAPAPEVAEAQPTAPVDEAVSEKSDEVAPVAETQKAGGPDAKYKDEIDQLIRRYNKKLAEFKNKK